MRSIEQEGKTPEEAIELGLENLGLTRDKVKVEITPYDPNKGRIVYREK